MSIPVSAFRMHSFLSILGTIPAPNQEWHHSARIFIPRNVILAGLWAKIDSSRFRQIPQEWPESGRNQWGMIKTSLELKTFKFLATEHKTALASLNDHKAGNVIIADWLLHGLFTLGT